MDNPPPPAPGVGPGSLPAAPLPPPAKKAPAPPKWETDTRERLRAALHTVRTPLADLVARDANEGDTRLLVTDFLCDGLGYDKYADLRRTAGTGSRRIATYYPSRDQWELIARSTGGQARAACE
jgi:hypothetical protein